MTPPSVTLLLFGVSVANLARLTALKQAQFKSADVGDGLTLNCWSHSDETATAYWFKQTPGQKPMMVSKFYMLSDSGDLQGQFSNDLRFSLDTGRQKNHLKISDLEISDSGTYHCVVSTLYNTEFIESVTVDVQKPGLPGLTSVTQSASVTVESGGSTTLSCTVQGVNCDGEHVVYWFKSSDLDSAGLVYAPGDGSQRCERTPIAQTRACVSNLPMTNLNQSQAGTYYCAVTACGHILYGNGTKVDLKGEPAALVNFLSCALAFAVVLILSLAFTVYKLSRQVQCAGTTLPAALPDSAASGEDGETLHYAAVGMMNTSSSRNKKDDIENTCVYSAVNE